MIIEECRIFGVTSSFISRKTDEFIYKMKYVENPFSSSFS